MTDPEFDRDRAGRRLCLFCENPANSKEHLFPDWLNSLFPTEVIGPSTAERFSATPETFQVKSWTTLKAASETIREVCSTCNNGWMARLEARAKPLLMPMAGGAAQLLDPAQQIIVATWAAKTIMVCERSVGRRYNFAPDDRRIVRLLDRPPGHVRIYCSAVQTDVGPLRFAHAAGEVLDHPVLAGVEVNFYTLQVGALVLQLIRGNPPPPVAGMWSQHAPERDLELPIFPPLASGVYWPTKAVLDERSFLAYTRRIAGDGVPPLMPQSARAAFGSGQAG
jgi:hypothetical protein